LTSNLEAFRYAWLEDVLAFDDGFVGLHPTDDVVGFDRQNLL